MLITVTIVFATFVAMIALNAAAVFSATTMTYRVAYLAGVMFGTLVGLSLGNWLVRR